MRAHLFRVRALTILVLSVVGAGCGGTTGGGIVSFQAAAAGPPDVPGGTLTFSNGFNYDVTLTQAVLHIGSLYLNQNAQPSIEISTSCIQDGVYVGEVLANLDVDILNPAPQPFSRAGDGLALPALEGEVWLNGPFDVNQVADTVQSTSDPGLTISQPVLTAAGSATNTADGSVWPFEATITIGENRQKPVGNPALPGEFEICTERVVNGLAVDFTPSNGGTLLVRIDPRQIFGGVKFGSTAGGTTLVQVPGMTPPLYQFANDNTAASDLALFNGIRSRASYQFTFTAVNQ